MSLEIQPYNSELEATWESFCQQACNSTFLHTRKFLSYPGDRFQDSSLIINASGKVVGLLPAAVSPTDSRVVISHPGITYGGIVSSGWLVGQRMIDALTLIADHYRNLGFSRIEYKPLPYLYPRVPSQDDLYALFRLKATRIGCNLASTIDLANRRPLAERRKRGLKKATSEVEVVEGAQYLPAFYEALCENLALKYGAQPVHSLREISLIMDRFPKNLRVFGAVVEGRLEAGILIFISPYVWHAQYIAASARGYELSALDAVFASAIQTAESTGVRYFDFGTSNENGGWFLNEGLYQFKSEFGGGGIAYERYELIL
jgi:hypothetical protein